MAPEASWPHALPGAAEAGRGPLPSSPGGCGPLPGEGPKPVVVMPRIGPQAGLQAEPPPDPEAASLLLDAAASALPPVAPGMGGAGASSFLRGGAAMPTGPGPPDFGAAGTGPGGALHMKVPPGACGSGAGGFVGGLGAPDFGMPSMAAISALPGKAAAPKAPVQAAPPVSGYARASVMGRKPELEEPPAQQSEAKAAEREVPVGPPKAPGDGEHLLALSRNVLGRKVTMKSAFEPFSVAGKVSFEMPGRSKAGTSSASGPTPEQKEASSTSNVKLYIGNIPRSAKESEIRAECARHGTITSLFHNEDQGWAYVSFATPEMADRAAQRIKAQALSLWGALYEPLEVRFASTTASESLAPPLSRRLEEVRPHEAGGGPSPASPGGGPASGAASAPAAASAGSSPSFGAGAVAAGSAAAAGIRERSKSRSRKRKRSRSHSRRRRRSRSRGRRRGKEDSPPKTLGAPGVVPTVVSKRRGLGGFDSSTTGGPGLDGGTADSPGAPGDERPRQVAARGSWAQFVTAGGTSYYHNITTGETTWEKPAEFDAPASRRYGNETGAETSLFIFHLPPAWSEADLDLHFKPFGSLLRTTVQRGSNGLSRGFGFVAFAKHEDAMLALNSMNGFHVEGKHLKVSLKTSASVNQPVAPTATKLNGRLPMLTDAAETP